MLIDIIDYVEALTRSWPKRHIVHLVLLSFLLTQLCLSYCVILNARIFLATSYEHTDTYTELFPACDALNL